MKYKMTTRVPKRSNRTPHPMSDEVGRLQGVLQFYYPSRRFKKWAIEKAEGYVKEIGLYRTLIRLSMSCEKYIADDGLDEKEKADHACNEWSLLCYDEMP